MIKDGRKRFDKQGFCYNRTHNTGIALVFVAAARGYRIILTMPETMSLERRNLLKALGAELVLTPGVEGMAEQSERLRNCCSHPPSYPNSFQILLIRKLRKQRQKKFEGYARTGGYLVAGVARRNNFRRGRNIEATKTRCEIIAVEPADSPVLSGGNKGPHKIQGIGAGFVPANFKREVVDEIFKVTNEEAFETSRKLSKAEGLLVGISSGASAFAATQIAKRPENKGKLIVALLPDTGERYLSTALYQDA